MAVSSWSARWVRRTQLLWKSVLLGLAMWGCLVWLEVVRQRIHGEGIRVSPEVVSCIMLRWALITVLVLSLLQYAFVLVRALGMIPSGGDDCKSRQLRRRLVGALIVFFLITGISAGVLAAAENFVGQTDLPWSRIAHSWDNFVVGGLALLFLILDTTCSPFLGAAASGVIKLDWGILISLIIGTIFLAQFGDRTAHEFIVGCNTGMLVFHMMLATLLFGIEEQRA